MSLAGLEHGGQGDRHGCGYLLGAERQDRSWLVLLLLVCPLTQWLEQPLVQAVPGPPVSHGGFWKNFLFYVASSSRCSHLELWTLPSSVSFSPSGVFLVACGVRRIGFGTRVLLGLTVDTCFTGGFGRISAFSMLR